MDRVRIGYYQNLLTEDHIKTLNKLRISAEGHRYVKFSLKKEENCEEKEVQPIKNHMKEEEKEPALEEQVLSDMLQSLNFFYPPEKKEEMYPEEE